MADTTCSACGATATILRKGDRCVMKHRVPAPWTLVRSELMATSPTAEPYEYRQCDGVMCENAAMAKRCSPLPPLEPTPTEPRAPEGDVPLFVECACGWRGYGRSVRTLDELHREHVAYRQWVDMKGVA